MVPTTAFAEVMDKEPSSITLWTLTAGFIGLGLLFSRWRGWAPLLVWPLSAAYGFATVSELLDPAVGPAILTEAGRGYVAQAYASAAMNFLAPLLLFAWCRRKPPRSQAPSHT